MYKSIYSALHDCLVWFHLIAAANEALRNMDVLVSLVVYGMLVYVAVLALIFMYIHMYPVLLYWRKLFFLLTAGISDS